MMRFLTTPGWPRRAATALAVASALLTGAATRAQVLEPFPELLDEVPGQPGAAALPVTGIAPRADGPSRAAHNAAAIAQRFPQAQRAAMQQTLQQSLDVYKKLEARFNWPGNDVAGAVAAFLVGNYMVMTGQQVPDEHFVAVAAQLRASLRLRSVLAAQPAQSLRDFYEQQAMVGTFMALAQMSHDRQPLPADRLEHLRQSARANLQMALRRNPADLMLGPNGLVMAPGR